MRIIDIQIDRIVGPLHHFGGLGLGNLASAQHAGQPARPAAAALEGLDKMRLVAKLGVPQLILPPQRRPAIRFLRSLGFAGTREQILASAIHTAPDLVSAACSSSAMWTANAATVSAASATKDGRVKLSVANLSSSKHRAIEPAETMRQLAHLFRSVGLSEHVDLYSPLPRGVAFRDEGAANHMYLSSTTQDHARGRGLDLFVYGDREPSPTCFLARQSQLACLAITRRHGLDHERTFLLKQHPRAIDAGAFHNDVAAMSHESIFIHHEHAFWDADQTLEQVRAQYERLTGVPLGHAIVLETELPLADAISSYLFNSQIVSTESSGSPPQRVLVCPDQVRHHDAAMRLVNTWRDRDRYFHAVHFVAVQESMSGGGGPACLRLRIPIDANLIADRTSRCWWSETTDAALRDIIQTHYPKQFLLADINRPEVIAAAMHATKLIRELLS